MRLTSLIPAKLRIWLRRAARATVATATVGIVAGGLAFTGTAQAVDLVTNGSFEQNNGFNGNNSGFGWTTTRGEDTTLGFDVYSHTTQVYYDGPAPAGAGDWYFHTVGLGTLGTTPVVVEQVVDVTGRAGDPFKFSAQISGFVAGGDTAVLDLIFDDGATSTFTLDGTTGGLDGITNTWDLFEQIGTIPAGATSAIVRISQATAGGSNGNDNYVDLVRLDVNEPGQEFVLGIDVTTIGNVSFANNTESDVDIEYYEIRSDLGSLIYNNWNSLTDQDLNPGTNEDDWLEGGQSDDTQLIEFYANGTMTVSTTGPNLSIGQVFDAVQNDRDLQFFYATPDGPLVQGVVNYDVTPGVTPGDFNADGVVDAADYTVWRDNLGDDESALNGAGDGIGVVDGDDYALWRSNFGAPGAAGLDNSAAGVPEPASWIASLLGVALLGGGRAFSRRP